MTDVRYRSAWAAGAVGLALGATTLGACGGDGSASGSSESGVPTPNSGSGAASPGTGGSSATVGTGGSSGTGPGASAGTGATNAGGTAGGMPEEPPPPPEKELESAFEAPVATKRFVWTANPTTNRVALINAETFEVRLADAGLAPTTVAALPGDDRDGAIVLNVGSEDATIVSIDDQGAIAATTVPTHAGANAVAVSPRGQWAVAWTDAAQFDETALDPTDGLQDVTVVDLRDTPRATTLSVGYRPSRVTFDEDETRAFIVTEPGLSIIELGDVPRAGSLIELTDDPVADQAARDVSVTPDGALAVVRVDATRALGFVDTVTGERQGVDLGNFVTDLDLSTDGKSAFAVAGSTLVVVPVPPGHRDPATFPRASVDNVVSRSVSLSPDTSLALLYANAEMNQYLTVLTSASDWQRFEGRALDLRAPVLAAFAAPDALHGIAFQSPASNSRKAGAFSIVSAQTDRAPKLIGTDAPPVAVSFASDGGTAVIATRDLAKASYGMYLVYLDNLEENFYALPSPPLAAGMVEDAKRAFVAQAHPEGRITFVDLEDGAARTLTGFELAAKVEKP